jgi:hypothetical protein
LWPCLRPAFQIAIDDKVASSREYSRGEAILTRKDYDDRPLFAQSR